MIKIIKKNAKNVLTNHKGYDIIFKRLCEGYTATKIRGCSSVVEYQPSKLTMWVRFPSPAPLRVRFPSLYVLVAQLDRATAF